MDDDERDYRPGQVPSDYRDKSFAEMGGGLETAIALQRVIPIRVKLVCGHWGQVMMSRLEYNEWVECGMPLYVNTGEPQPCDRCKGLDSPEPLRHIEGDGSQHTPT